MMESRELRRPQTVIVGDTLQIALGTGALDDARAQGHLDVPLSTVPQLDLLP